MYALIINGIVSEITKTDPDGRFHPSMKWVICPGNVRPGWNHDGGIFTPQPEPSSPTLKEIYAFTVETINAAFEAASKTLLGVEPPSAVSTWSIQESEAIAWEANPAAPTPMLDTLAMVRGIDKADLVGRVLAKAALYKQASGLLLGQQQALIDRIWMIMGGESTDAEKIEALQELDIAIGLPEGWAT